jgi:FkbM family methyltransferase
MAEPELLHLRLHPDAGGTSIAMWGRGGARGQWDRAIGEEVLTTYLWERYPAGIRTAIDIGGHVGWWTRILRIRCPEARVAVIEPDAESFALLELNLGRDPAVSLYNAACGYLSTPMSILRHRENSGAVCLVRAEDAAAHLASGEWLVQENVPLVPLEPVMDALTQGEIDLVKCDCEAGEYDIFRNVSLDHLRRIRCIVGEHHGSVELFRAEIGGRIESAGFALTCVPHPDPAVKDLGMFWAQRRGSFAAR